MLRRHTSAGCVVVSLLLGGCETLPQEGLGDFGKVFGDVFDTAAGTASGRMIRNTADSMCSPGNVLCRNVTVVAMSGFTEAFIRQLTQSDVREINEARERSIATGEDQVWQNPQTGAFGQVTSEPAEPRPPAPTPIKVKRDRLESLPMMDAVGETMVVGAEGGANVRGGPSTDYEVVDRLDASERIRAIGKVRETDWFLVGRDSVGIGYVFGDLLEPWSPPAEEPEDEAPPAVESAPEEDVAQVDVEMASECFTTKQTVTLANGESEAATVTSCRTPDGWVTV